MVRNVPGPFRVRRLVPFLCLSRSVPSVCVSRTAHERRTLLRQSCVLSLRVSRHSWSRGSSTRGEHLPPCLLLSYITILPACRSSMLTLKRDASELALPEDSTEIETRYVYLHFRNKSDDYCTSNWCSPVLVLAVETENICLSALPGIPASTSAPLRPANEGRPHIYRFLSSCAPRPLR